MMIWNRLGGKSVISPTVLVWFTFISLFGICKVQESGVGVFTVPIVIVTVGSSFLCFCFRVFFAVVCYTQQKSANISTVPPTTTTQYTFNLQRRLNYSQNQVNGPVASSTTSQTVPALSSEPIILLEVTLHNEEAPRHQNENIESCD